VLCLLGRSGAVSMKILVIEDEKKLASYLQKGLSSEGFVVDVATTALTVCTWPSPTAHREAETAKAHRG